jgi:uncharacterized protein (DUF1778 family)
MTDTMKGRSERVDLRMTPATKRTRQSAAERQVFELDQKHWDAFTGALASPPKDNPKLRKLLARRPAWQK